MRVGLLAEFLFIAACHSTRKELKFKEQHAKMWGKYCEGEKILSPPWFQHCGDERRRRSDASGHSHSSHNAVAVPSLPTLGPWAPQPKSQCAHWSRRPCAVVCDLVSYSVRLSQRNRTVVVSIHQPRYAIFRLFDRLTLLAAGNVIYHGKATEALDFFQTLGIF